MGGTSKRARLEKKQRGVYVRSVRLMKGQTPRTRPGAQFLWAGGYEALAAYAHCGEDAVRHAVMEGRLDPSDYDSIFRFAAGMRQSKPKEPS